MDIKTETETEADILAVGHVAPDDERNLLLAQLLDGDLKRVGLALEVDEDGGVHADLQGARAEDAGPLVLSHVRGGGAFLVRNLLVLVGLVVALATIGLGGGVAGDDDVLLVLGAAAVVLIVLVSLGHLGFELVIFDGILVVEHGLLAVSGWSMH